MSTTPLEGISTARTIASNMNGVGSPLQKYQDGGYGPAELNSHEIKNSRQIGNGEDVPNDTKVQFLYELGGDMHK